jgi:hypothetical protein
MYEVDYNEIDEEVRHLCRAMNSVSKKICTVEACAGHGRHPVWIFFECRSLRELPKLLYWFSACHSGESGWKVTVATDCAMSFPTFCLEGPDTGEDAYRAAEHIARCIEARDYVP